MILQDFMDKMHVKPRLFFFNSFLLSQARCRADFLHGGVEGTRAEVRPGDAEVLCAVPVRLWCRGAQWASTGETVRTMDPFPSYCTKRKDTDQLDFLMRAVVICSAFMRWGSVICSWEAQTWTLVTLWIIHRISCRASSSRRTWGEIHKLHH